MPANIALCRLTRLCSNTTVLYLHVPVQPSVHVLIFRGACKKPIEIKDFFLLPRHPPLQNCLESEQRGLFAYPTIPQMNKVHLICLFFAFFPSFSFKDCFPFLPCCFGINMERFPLVYQDQCLHNVSALSSNAPCSQRSQTCERATFNSRSLYPL